MEVERVRRMRRRAKVIFIQEIPLISLSFYNPLHLICSLMYRFIFDTVLPDALHNFLLSSLITSLFLSVYLSVDFQLM